MQLLKEVSQIKTIYDLLALCCSYIFIETQKNPYDFQTFDDSKYDDMYDSILEYTFNRRNIGEFNAFEELRKQVKIFFGSKTTIEKCFALVQFIDDLIEEEIFDRFVKKKGIINYNSLSHRYVDRVRVIPKQMETFIGKGSLIYKEKTKDEFDLFRKKHNCPCCDLDRTTTRYMICDKSVIDKYPFSIHRLADKHPVSIHFKDRNRINIAIFPFTNEKVENILNIQFERDTFYINEMYELAKEKLQKRYCLIYEKCIHQDIDFLVFPEMLMAEDIMNKLNIKGDAPQIIINGSIWDSLSNKSIVTDGNLDEIFSYYKKEPYKHKINGKTYTEHLDLTKNKEFDLLEIPGIGRVGVCICKDLINESVKMFHRYLGTNLLIVPAYTSSNDLLSSAKNLAEEFNCIVVVANSCSAIGNKQKNCIGFLSLPAKKDTTRTSLVREYGNKDCAGECIRGCCGKLFSILFEKVEQYDGVISFKVIEDTL